MQLGSACHYLLKINVRCETRYCLLDLWKITFGLSCFETDLLSCRLKLSQHSKFSIIFFSKQTEQIQTKGRKCYRQSVDVKPHAIFSSGQAGCAICCPHSRTVNLILLVWNGCRLKHVRQYNRFFSHDVTGWAGAILVYHFRREDTEKSCTHTHTQPPTAKSVRCMCQKYCSLHMIASTLLLY